MFVQDVAHRLYFDDQAIGNVKVREVFSQRGPTSSSNTGTGCCWMTDSFLPQPIASERIFAHFFQVTIAMIAVNREAGFANDVGEGEDIHRPRFLTYGIFRGEALSFTAEEEWPQKAH